MTDHICGRGSATSSETGGIMLEGRVRCLPCVIRAVNEHADLIVALNKCREFARGAVDSFTSRGVALDDIFEVASDAVAKATKGV